MPAPDDFLTLEPLEVRMLICNRAAFIANGVMHGAEKQKLIEIGKRIVELAMALPDKEG